MIGAARAPSRRALIAAGASALAVGPGATQQQALDGPIAIGVRAHPIQHFKVGDAETARFGACVFRGGLELSSRHAAFGGLSGIAMDPDGGGFLAVTDVGNWLRAKIDYEGVRPVALRDCVIAPVLNADGAPVKRTRWDDCEGRCLDGGVAYVSVERVHDVLRFDWARDGFAARGRSIPAPPAMKKLPGNRGCEAIGVAPSGSPIAGALVAISERSGARNEPTLGFILTGDRRGEFQVALKDEFDVTDIAFLPGGDMLLLERYYRPLRGVAMRIRRIAGSGVAPGAILDGPALIEADLGFQIDNMEALGVHRAPGGETILTILSDDNFSIIQRTLLLQFALAA